MDKLFNANWSQTVNALCEGIPPGSKTMLMKTQFEYCREKILDRRNNGTLQGKEVSWLLKCSLPVLRRISPEEIPQKLHPEELVDHLLNFIDENVTFIHGMITYQPQRVPQGSKDPEADMMETLTIDFIDHCASVLVNRQHHS